MLLIHRSKHNNTGDILKNGIRPQKRKSLSEGVDDISGVWCFPFTRNKTLNNNWKSNLKVWRQDVTNFKSTPELLQEDGLFYMDFEIIIPEKIEPKRIIKVIKDRKTLKR